MSALHQVKAGDRIIPPLASWVATVPWSERISLARCNAELAPMYLTSIRDEAAKLATPGSCDRIINTAIANAASDCLAVFTFPDQSDLPDWLDRLDELLFGDDT